MEIHKFKTIGEAWLFGLRRIMEVEPGIVDEHVSIRDISLNKSENLLTKYQSQSDKTKLHLKLKEILGYSIIIESINEDDPIIKDFADHNRIAYTRLRYGKNSGVGGYGNFIYGKNEQNIDVIVNKLKSNPNSKSAVICSPNSWVCNSYKPPCLTSIGFFIRDFKLQIFVTYRSQNVYTKQLGNILALSDLQNEVASRLGLSSGSFHLYVYSAHIYESDWEESRAVILGN